MKSIITIIAIFAVLPAYAAGYSGQDYSGSEARRAYQLETGKIEAMREVMVDDTSTTTQVVGGSVGGLIGGVLGQAVSGKAGYAVSALLGTAGAAAGVAVTNAMLRSKGYEYVVRMDDGRVIAIVQGIDHEYPIAVGDRVRLVHGSNTKLAKISSY